MPLPRFLALLAAVILAGGLTVAMARLAGLPMAGLALAALLAAAALRLRGRR